jgi:hypothetical protein
MAPCAVSNDCVSRAKPPASKPPAPNAADPNAADPNVTAPDPSAGGSPWPPPGADDSWWTDQGGTDGDGAPTSPAPSETSAPDATAPSDARVAADIETVDLSEVDGPVEPDVGHDDAAATTAPEAAAEVVGHRNAPETGFPTHRTPTGRPAPSPRPASRRATVPLPAPAPSGEEAGFAALFGDDDGRGVATATRWRDRRGTRPGLSRNRPKNPRRPALGLPALLFFALAAAFFAWVSATPLWLAVGHGSRGVATVASCNVHGIDRSCADFTAADHSFSTVVTLLGPGTEHAKVGEKLAATVVSRGSSLAYTGSSPDYSLRWIPGIALLALCGLGIAWATGAKRLADRRARTIAMLGSFGGPFLVLVGMLAYTW